MIDHSTYTKIYNLYKRDIYNYIKYKCPYLCPAYRRDIHQEASLELYVQLSSLKEKLDIKKVKFLFLKIAWYKCCTHIFRRYKSTEALLTGYIEVTPNFAAHKDPIGNEGPYKYDLDLYTKQREAKLKNISYKPKGRPGKPIEVYSTSGDYINTFDNSYIASEELSIPQSTVARHLKNPELKTKKNSVKYIFKYEKSS